MSEQVLIGVLAGVIVVLLLAVSFLLGRRGRVAAPAKPELAPIALPAGMEALEPTFIDLRRQLSELGGKVEQVRASAEARQGPENQAWQGIQQVQTALEAIKGRQTQEDRAFEELDRLAEVLLGSKAAGDAGERVVEEALSTLPPQWVLRNHRMNNQPVEYAIRLPDGHILPIDSKVVAQSEVHEWEQTEDKVKRAKLENEIRGEVNRKAADIRKYLGNGSTEYGIITLPDGIYRFCRTLTGQAYQKHRALLVPYTLLAPFVLMVYERHRNNDLDLRVERTQRLLSDAAAHLHKADEMLNQNMADSITRVNNAYDNLRRELSEAVSALTLLRDMATTNDA